MAEPDYLTLKNEVAFKLFFCPYGVGTVEKRLPSHHSLLRRLAFLNVHRGAFSLVRRLVALDEAISVNPSIWLLGMVKKKKRVGSIEFWAGYLHR
jgi:hypothetical protein